MLASSAFVSELSLGLSPLFPLLILTSLVEEEDHGPQIYPRYSHGHPFKALPVGKYLQELVNCPCDQFLSKYGEYDWFVWHPSIGKVVR